MSGGVRAALPWAAPVTAMAVVSVSLSLTVPLFALLLERQGATGAEIGLNHTISALAMVISAPLLPRLLARVGLVWLMVSGCAALAAGMVLIPVWESQIWWGCLRIIFGFAGTALFFSSEYWVVTRAPEALRGRIVGGYVVILSASYMAGPLILNALGVEGYAIFFVPAAVFLAAAVPVILGRAHAPSGRTDNPPRTADILGFFRSDPMVTWGVLLFGVIEFGAMSLVAVWGLRSGLDQETSVRLIFWLAFGSLAFQFPVGWAADRFDRRLLLALAGLISLVCPLIILATDGMTILIVCVVFWGGAAVAFYSLALTELGARYKGVSLARGNAAVVLAYGLGALVSPAAFGLAMDAIPPDGLLWLAALAACAYLALAVIRISRARAAGLDTGDENGR